MGKEILTFGKNTNVTTMRLLFFKNDVDWESISI